MAESGRIKRSIRSPNWTEDETLLLIDLYDRRKDVLKTRVNNQAVSKLKRDAWAAICQELFSHNLTHKPAHLIVRRSLEEVQKKWQNLCTNVKQEIAKNWQKSSEGQPPRPLSVIWQKVADILAEDSANVNFQDVLENGDNSRHSFGRNEGEAQIPDNSSSLQQASSLQSPLGINLTPVSTSSLSECTLSSVRNATSSVVSVSSSSVSTIASSPPLRIKTEPSLNYKTELIMGSGDLTITPVSPSSQSSFNTTTLPASTLATFTSSCSQPNVTSTQAHPVNSTAETTALSPSELSSCLAPLVLLSEMSSSSTSSPCILSEPLSPVREQPELNSHHSSKRKRKSEEAIKLHLEILKLEKDKITLEHERIAIEKEKLHVEKEKLELERENLLKEKDILDHSKKKILLEKKKMQLESKKLKSEISKLILEKEILQLQLKDMKR